MRPASKRRAMFNKTRCRPREEPGRTAVAGAVTERGPACRKYATVAPFNKKAPTQRHVQSGQGGNWVWSAYILKMPEPICTVEILNFKSFKIAKITFKVLTIIGHDAVSLIVLFPICRNFNYIYLMSFSIF